MGGQTALGYYDSDAHLVSYWFMRDMSPLELTEYLREPYNVMKDVARPLLAGNCLLEEFKSRAFQDEHDLVWAVMVLPESMVCYNRDYVVIMKKRQ